jgi:hypothetical protein
MDEFGQQNDVQEEDKDKDKDEDEEEEDEDEDEEEEDDDDDGEVPRNLDKRRPSRDAVPFSSYAPPDLRLMDPKATGAAQRQQQQQKDEVEDEQDAGCCKCVIM